MQTCGADRHRRVIVDPHAFAQPDVVAELQEPRVLDGDARLDHEARADPGAEARSTAAFQRDGRTRALWKTSALTRCQAIRQATLRLPGMTGSA